MQLTVGRVARAHGIRGEVVVEVRTDDPDGRFATGQLLQTVPAPVGPLTVERARRHGTRLLVQFAGVHGREAADALRGVRLAVDVPEAQRPADPDEFFDHQLEGLAARLLDGSPVGVVSQVLHLPLQDLLVIRRDDGGEALVPFVRQLVPVVDVDAGEVVLDPPPGLLDGSQP